MNCAEVFIYALRYKKSAVKANMLIFLHFKLTRVHTA